MPATKKRKWRGPGRYVSVADQRTARTATAIASEMVLGKTENDWRNRELDLTIEVGHGVDRDTEVFVRVGVTDCFTGRGDKNVVRRDFNISTQLADLPLLAMALEEAIRIGVEQGTFLEIRGGKKS